MSLQQLPGTSQDPQDCRIFIGKNILPLDGEVELEWEGYSVLSCLVTELK